MELRPAQLSDLPEITGLLAKACRFDSADVVAQEKLFAPLPTPAVHSLVALEHGRIQGVVGASGKWLRLLAVAPEKRGRGIGAALLAWAEERGACRTLDQPGNYLSPGVDIRNLESIAWLQKRGYQEVRRNTNLIVELRANAAAKESSAQQQRERMSALGLRVMQVSPDDAVLGQIESAFSQTWRFEATRAAAAGGLFVALDDQDALAGFAAHDGNNQGLGWFGPAGTVDGQRGKGIGAALLIQCLAALRRAGHAQCEVAWIGPEAFYQRVCGVQDRREFAVLSKDLLNTES